MAPGENEFDIPALGGRHNYNMDLHHFGLCDKQITPSEIILGKLNKEIIYKVVGMV